jgi:parallel beta-helix repeat protein
LAAACYLPAASAKATTLTVNTNKDAPTADGLCGLREALTAINTRVFSSDCHGAGNGNNDTIVLPAATTFQTSTALDAVRSVTIVGAGSSSTFIESGAAHAIGAMGTTTPGRNPVVGLTALTLRKLATQSQPVVGVLVNAGNDPSQTSATVNMNQVVVTGFNSNGVVMSAPDTDTNGFPATQATGVLNASASSFTNNAGAGIQAAGSSQANLTGCTISGNNNSGMFFMDGALAEVHDSSITGNSINGNGGGIHVEPSSGCLGVKLGNFGVEFTTVSGNRASGNGGGIFWGGEQGLAIKQSTISGNNANNGGGIYYQACADYISMEYSTVATNVAKQQGGGIFLDHSRGSTVSFNADIIASNMLQGSMLASSNGLDLYDATAVSVFSCVMGSVDGWFCFSGVGNDDCSGTVAPGQGFTLDPVIGALGNFGGPTKLHPLLTGSPAVDLSQSPDHDTSPADQRSFPRFVSEAGGSPYDPIEGNGVAPAGADVGSFERQCPAELVTNPSFETGTSGWVASTGATISTIAGSPTTPFPHAGYQSLIVTNRTQGTWQGAIFNLLGIAHAGETLKASGWALIGNDPSQPVLLTRRAVCSGGQPTYQTVASGTGNNTSWTFLSGTASIPNCTLTELTVYFEGPRIGATLLVDEVSIVRPTGACETITAQRPLAASLPVLSDVGTSFCVNMQVGNPNPVATTNWSVSLDLNGTTITSRQNLNSTGTTGTVTLTPSVAANRVISASGVTVGLGFCASRPSGSQAFPRAPVVSGTF